MKVIRNLFLILVMVVLAACGTAQSSAPAESTPIVTVPTEVPPVEKPLAIGMILVGPINDGGWSQAHYDAMKRVEADAGVKFIYVDKVNPADRPNVKVEQVAQELIDQGATMIIANSDDFKDGIAQAAAQNPDVNFIHASGDAVLAGTAPANLGNMMGKMEYGKMIAGCAAALQTKTNKVAYLGPLINDETRRLVNAAYLGAKHCNDKVEFTVTWVGFWFNIPGVTLDPTKIMADFFTQGNDVVISGIDTPDAIIEAAKAKAAGKDVYAIPYDHETACERGPDACLGVPYFNWYPEYMKMTTALKDGTWAPDFVLFGPNWEDMNNPDTSGIGFKVGNAFTHQDKLDEFIGFLAKGGTLFVGPLNYQDGKPFLTDGEIARTEQVWYQTNLLEGITGKGN